MAGRTQAEAVKAFVAPIQAALGMFLDGKVTADNYRAGEEGVLTLNNGEVVGLRAAGKLGLSVSMRYKIVASDDRDRGPWKVTTTGYMYDLLIDGTPQYEYHWHPISSSHEVRPHLHCSALGKGHIPTGRVMIEDVLKLAFQQGAEPRDEKRWEKLDKRNREMFARGATWGVGPS